VKVLVDGRREAGSHTVTFNAAGLASGVYLYRLEARPLGLASGIHARGTAADQVLTRRMLLVR
jgi:hypothetical protein